MRNLKPVLFIQSVIVSLALLFSAYYFMLGLRVDSFIFPLCVITVLLSAWTLVSWNRVTGHFFDLYTIFIAGTAAFNCGQVFLEVFGLNAQGLLFGKFTNTVLFETVLFVILAFSMIHLGALLRVSKMDSIPEAGKPEPAPQALLQVGLLLISISILPVVWSLKDMYDVVRTSGYFGLYVREDQIGIHNVMTLIANFFLPGALFTLAGSRDRKQIQLWSQVGIIFYGSLLILIGRRGDGAEALVSYLIVRHYCIRPVNKKLVFTLAALMMIVVFPLIATIRNIDLEKRGDITMMITAYENINNPGVSAIAEMGGSMQAISHTIVLVPKTRDYDFGASYLYAAFSIFPNLFWSIHPSVSHGSPSVWLVKTVEPDIAERGGGLGYSYIAEAYFNFGWWGGAIMLFWIGYGLSSLVCWSQFSGNPLKIAAAATFFASLLGFVRADSQSIIRPLFWYSLFPYLLAKWIHARRKPDLKFRT